MARDGKIWLNQNQMAELFATSKQNIGQLTSNILLENELDKDSVVKYFFTTAVDGKLYNNCFLFLSDDYCCRLSCQWLSRNIILESPLVRR